MANQPSKVLAVQVHDGILSPRQFNNGADVGHFKGIALGSSNICHVHERVLAAPLALASLLELAVVAVVARFWFRRKRDFLVQQRGELASQPTPIWSKLLNDQ